MRGGSLSSRSLSLHSLQAATHGLELATSFIESSVGEWAGWQ